MSPTSTLPTAKPSVERAPVVNECSIQVGTVNGSGSQTANNTLLRAIFQMGIPVSGKNLFPSNIAGLPTWFTIRANKHGYIARRKEIDVLVCMNADTAVDDVKAAQAGAAVIYEDLLGLDKHRTDLVFYPVPFQKIVKEVCPDPKLRKLVINMTKLRGAPSPWWSTWKAAPTAVPESPAAGLQVAHQIGSAGATLTHRVQSAFVDGFGVAMLVARQPRS